MDTTHRNPKHTERTKEPNNPFNPCRNDTRPRLHVCVPSQRPEAKKVLSMFGAYLYRIVKRV
jgi:hypothetical protein